MTNQNSKKLPSQWYVKKENPHGTSSSSPFGFVDSYTLVLVPSAIGQGFQFSATFVAILAASTQAEQAVVTGTLLLWRSLGSIIGIAASSVIVQNSLAYFLQKTVRGAYKDEVIRQARTSIRSIALLEQPYQEQVICSYHSALMLTFEFGMCLAVISLLIIMPLKLKHLKQ
ncbi:hypothetical protein BGZ63DRAFT_368342 [Mariannaea sp. PMI_226]|nr:hypothetical protein BGZ63DRAFT_368342 [Mariannaea sp. PMI_226]